MTPITAESLLPEIIFSTSRSSGPGGQNVNKVNSKVTLKLSIPESLVLDDEQKSLLLRKLAPKITKDGVLMLTSQEARSQLENRSDVIVKLDELLKKAFARVKKRKPTKPGKGAKLKRLNNKKQQSEKKQWRQKL